MQQSSRPLRWTPEHAAAVLSAPGPQDDKYRRGVLGLRTGSAAFPGAAVLGAEAAWRTGLGLLRFVPQLDDPAHSGLPSPAAAVLAARPETVVVSPHAPDQGLGRCDAWLIGSGTDPDTRSEAERDALGGLLRGRVPVVVDAGALGLVRDAGEEPEPGAAPGPGPGPGPGPAMIVTPHRGEFRALWRQCGLPDPPPGWSAGRAGRDRAPAEGSLAAAAATLAARLGATVLLKGSLTIVATPAGTVLRAGPATPWLATAGTGDVLAGILAALVTAHGAAVREDPELLGAIGASAAVLHDAAARRAAGAAPSPHGEESGLRADAGGEDGPRGGPITALDVARAVPATVAELLAARARRSSTHRA